MVKKKSKSGGSRSMKEALADSKGTEMDSCECGSGDCSQCGTGFCCGGESCGSCCASGYGGGYGCYGCGSGKWGYLKYVKLIVGILLVVSALWPSVVSTRAAVGVLGLWIVFKTALKLYYKY